MFLRSKIEWVYFKRGEREALMLITKKWMDRLTGPYRSSGMFRCLAESQSLDSISSKVILLIDETKVTILFLNFFKRRLLIISRMNAQRSKRNKSH